MNFVNVEGLSFSKIVVGLPQFVDADMHIGQVNETSSRLFECRSLMAAYELYLAGVENLQVCFIEFSTCKELDARI